METKFIYHIFEPSTNWSISQLGEEYAPEGWEKEGFIHASTRNQILPTLNRWFEGKDEVKVMELSIAKIKGEVKFEDLYNHGQEFPHIYGRINTNAIESILDFKRNAEGYFEQVG